MEVSKREIRIAELRAKQSENDADMIVEGYAAVFNVAAVMLEYDGMQYREMIAPGAFDGCDMSDVPLKWNHSDTALIMARTRNKTLILSVDATGLAVRANIAPTTQGRDLYTLIQRGDVDKMSMAFVVAEETYDNGQRLRTITRFKKLYDVAAVGDPAYDATSISARSYFDARREMDELAQKQQELQRKRLVLATYL